MTKYIYLHQKPRAISFTQLPNFLFELPGYHLLGNEAKILYAMVLRRAGLSRKNGWADEYDRVYLYYPINEVTTLLHCGRQKAVDTLQGTPIRRAAGDPQAGMWKAQSDLPKMA